MPCTNTPILCTIPGCTRKVGHLNGDFSDSDWYASLFITSNTKTTVGVVKLSFAPLLGVPVISYGPTDDFPAFYTRKSGFKSPWRVNDPESAARILHTHRQLGVTNGAIFAVPIQEEYESVGQELQRAVEQAIRESEANGMSRHGKEATPWLLKRVGELTSGKSLRSNIALIENTATVGGQIAVAYARLAGATNVSQHPHVVHLPPTSVVRELQEATELPPAKLIVVGSAAVDITARADPVPGGAGSNNNLHTTTPGVVSITSGGVGRNVAEAAHRILTSYSKDLTSSAMLVSPIGKDAFGQLLASESERIGMRTDGFIQVQDARTAVCNMVLDSAGGLTSGVADMDVIRTLDATKVIEILDRHQPTVLALDANMSPDSLKELVTYANKQQIATFFEPTSVPKSTTIFPAVAASLNSASLSRAPVTFATPNVLELAHMYQVACASPLELTAHKYWWQVIDDMTLGSEFRMELEQLSRRRAFEDESSSLGNLSFLVDNGIAQMAINLLPFFQHLIIKCGERGLIAVFRISGERAQSSGWANQTSNIYSRQIVAHNKTGSSVVVFKHFPPIRVADEKIVNVTGAGDSLVGSMLATLSQAPGVFETPEALEQAVGQAQLAAVYTLQSEHAVSPRLSSLGSNGSLH
ncbi:hypothetical protein V8D89_016336 [Ganoderma adspersum]